MHGVCVCVCSNSVCVPTGSVAFISFSKCYDPKSLRITRIDSTSNDQKSIFLSEMSKVVSHALVYQELKEGCTRSTEAGH